MSGVDIAGLVSEWRKAMEGVSAGPWRHYRNKLRPQFGGIINEVQCRSKTPVVAWPGFEDSKRKEPKHALNAAWIARCSPSGISALLDALLAQAAELAEARREVGELKDRLKNSYFESYARELCYRLAAENEAKRATRQRDEALAALKVAREALEPFAEAAASYDPDEGDGRDVAWSHDFTIASLRRARSVLENSKARLADATNKTPSDPGTEQREAGR